MRPWLLPFLRCPACCEGDLHVERRDEVHDLPEEPDGGGILVSGVLRCVRCAARFPVLEESPRLLDPALLNVAERAVLDRPDSARAPARAPAIRLSHDQVLERVRERIMEDYHHPVAGPALRRAQADVAYQMRYEASREYQMAFLATLLPHPPELIVDVGGGRGGNLRAARKAMRSTRGIVLDMDEKWPGVFRTEDRSTVYIRADATRLPLKSGVAALAISSFLLEHVAGWRDVVLEIGRVSRMAFVAFGPNVAFPWEFGHIDAPFAHTLPPALGAFSAFLWDRVSGNRRTYARLREIISTMHWPSSRAYYRFCRERGLSVDDLFPAMMAAWAGAGGTGVRAFLGRYPDAARSLARTFSALHVEPNVYSILRARSLPEPPNADPLPMDSPRSIS